MMMMMLTTLLLTFGSIVDYDDVDDEAKMMMTMVNKLIKRIIMKQIGISND